MSTHLENKTIEAIEKEAKLNQEIATLRAKDVRLSHLSDRLELFYKFTD